MTDSIAQVVREITRAQQVILFGSRVTGNERSDSDYDVLVVLADRVGQKERLRLA